MLGDRESFIGGDNLLGDSGGELEVEPFVSGEGGGFVMILETGVKEMGAGEVLVVKVEVVVLEQNADD